MNIFEALEAGNGKACTTYLCEEPFYAYRDGDVFKWGNMPSGGHPTVSDFDLKRNDWLPYLQCGIKEYEKEKTQM